MGHKIYTGLVERWQTLRPIWGIKYGTLRLELVCSDARLGT
jgi:hypothetical protein